MTSLTIAGGQVLAADGWQDGPVRIEDGRIAAIGGAATDGAATGRVLDARGLMVLPGLIDLHGDAFERQLQPRPGVGFPTGLALMDTEAQLLANGITTAFHGVTLSWEPGLRSLGAWRALLEALAEGPPGGGGWTCDMRVHLRWEAFNLPALDQALADIAAGRVHLLAFNDHTPSIMRRIDDAQAAAKYSDRAGMKLDEFRAVATAIWVRADDVPAARDRIAAAARTARLPMASHDDDSLAVRGLFRDLGARISEFPMAEDVAKAAADAGDWVVMGSPNVVRGGSHLGWASAAQMAEGGVCRVLTSDYFYPAMLRAAFVLAARGVLDLPAAWALVSANPARAAGLADRGAIAPGLRGDVLLVDPAGPRVLATIVGGAIAHATAEGYGRLGG